MAIFPGLPAEGVKFLSALARNNRREWFQPRKHIYEERVKAPMAELVTALNSEMMRFAPDYVNEPAKAIYRIYRDTRFSKDKTPYKTHIAAIFPRRGLEKHGGGGLYFSVSAKEIEGLAACICRGRRRCWPSACIWPSITRSSGKSSAQRNSAR